MKKLKRKKRATIGQAMIELLEREQRGETSVIFMAALNKPLGGQFLADPRIPPDLIKDLMDQAQRWADTLVELQPGYWVPKDQVDAIKAKRRAIN